MDLDKPPPQSITFLQWPAHLITSYMPRLVAMNKTRPHHLCFLTLTLASLLHLPCPRQVKERNKVLLPVARGAHLTSRHILLHSRSCTQLYNCGNKTIGVSRPFLRLGLGKSLYQVALILLVELWPYNKPWKRQSCEKLLGHVVMTFLPGDCSKNWTLF